MIKKGWKQFLPFIVTVIAIVFTNLLFGISLGLIVGVFVVIIKSFQNSHFLHKEDNSNGKSKIKMTFAEEVTFINKEPVLRELERLPETAQLELDVKKTKFLDFDILEIINDFMQTHSQKNIHIRVITERGVFENPKDLFRTIFPHQRTG